jgi:endo-1,4-beta-xylanase
MKLLNSNLKMKSHTVSAILVLIFAFSSATEAQNDDLDKSITEHRKGEIVVKAKPGAEVTIEQLKHEFWFGCAISNSIFSGSASEFDRRQYKEKFLENFNSAVTENAVKWGNMEPRKGEVNYAIVDAIMEWTEENDIPLRGHNIFWGTPRFVQSWVKELPDDELIKTLRNRAETLTSRYKGRFAEYDLNNEMIHGNYYEDRLGPDITRMMVQWARNGDPEIKLFMNEFDILTGRRLPDYLALIREFQEQGVPFAGIGVQGHLHSETFDRGELKRALDSLAQFHMPIRITEFNMPGQRSKYQSGQNVKMTQKEEEEKAKNLTDYYRICFAHPAVEGILMWGFWEGANWIPQSSLYYKDWTPTPAAEAYQNLVFREWWTNVTGKANAGGEFLTPAFYGKYRITADGKVKEVTLSKATGKITVEF